ncbi:hypothetical protein DFS33DRAFT_1381055 [Desarmillaria ectypa]|nr:hypothetical protein DFS33DRAFT_1381055 [Desarmillaria ectypa]
MSPRTSSTRPKRRSASDTSGIEALNHLFTRRPTFTKRPGFTGSGDTRGYAHYDMHLHPRLILKDIVSFPDMLDQLSGVVDSKIQDFISNSPTKRVPCIPVMSVLRKAAVSEVVETPGHWVIGPEADLQRAYPRLEQYPTLVASTLVAGLDKWTSIFQYNEKPRVSTACAVADGYLSLNKNAIETTNIPAALKDKLQSVIEQDLSDFLFWEYKSMNAGRRGIMLAIDHTTGSQFPWASCPRSESCSKTFCRKKDNRFKFSVTGFKTGVDGVILEDSPNDDNRGKRNADLSFAFDKSRIHSSLLASVPDTRRWKFKESKSSKKRVRQESDTGNRHSNDDDDERRARDDDEDEDDSNVHGTADDTLPFTEADYLTALVVIQQIWAEAVNIDATFMVLNCGNLEYIGIRDRKLQRLYLSPLLDLGNPLPDSPGYFKIHTGLNIVALLDAIKRAEKLKAMRQLPELYTFKYDRSVASEDKVPKTSSKRGRPSRSARTPGAVVNATTFSDSDQDDEDSNSWELDFSPEEKQLFRRLREAQTLKITWKKNINGLGTASSMRMTRKRSTWPAYTDTRTEEIEVFVINQCPTSTLTYYCYVDDGETAIRGIVVKFAKVRDRKVGIRNEYGMYTKFPSIEGIIEQLGIVEEFGLYQSMVGCKMALVLLDGGDPITTKLGLSRISAATRLQIREAVEKMHSEMVTHGNLAPDNVLITKDPENKKGGWKIHLISWRNGKDYRKSTALQEAYDEDATRMLDKRPRKLNWRSMEPDLVPHRMGAPSKKTVARKRTPGVPRFGIIPKAKVKLAVKENLRRYRSAVKADLEMLQDNGLN